MPENSNAILIISSEFPPGPGGIGNHAYNLALSLSQAGKAVTVVADINNTSTQHLDTFKATVPFTFKALLRKNFAPLTYLQRVSAAILAAAKCKYIICSGKFSLWLVLMLKLIYPSKKYIAVVHGTELDLKGKYAKKLTDKALARFTAIVSVSAYTQSFLPASVKAKVYNCIIPNGINNSEFEPYIQPPHKTAYAAEDVIPVITIGNVTERKGQENVIRALPTLIKAYPKLHYHIAGKATEKERLLKIADELNVTQHLTFYGIMPREQLLQLLGNCAVKFMLSNHTKDGDFEGFGIAILEANAMGKPAIGANFGGITDAVDNGRTGRLADIHNPAEITACLTDILEHYSSYSANALQWSAAHDWHILVNQYLDVINEIS